MNARLKSWLIMGLLLGTAVYAIAEDLTLTGFPQRLHRPTPRLHDATEA